MCHPCKTGRQGDSLRGRRSPQLPLAADCKQAGPIPNPAAQNPREQVLPNQLNQILIIVVVMSMALTPALAERERRTGV